MATRVWLLTVALLALGTRAAEQNTARATCSEGECRHKFGFAYEWYFGSSATVDDPMPAQKLNNHTSLCSSSSVL